MRGILAVVFAIALTSVPANAAPSSSNPPASLETQLTDFISQAQVNFNNLTKELQERLNIPDQETFVKNVKDQSSNLITNIQEYINNATEQIKNNPELERSWNNVKTKLNKVVDDVNSGIPDAQQQVADLQSKFQQAIQAILKESDTTAKSLGQYSGKVQEELAKLTKQVVSVATEATQNLNNQLQAATAQKS
ncbi:hypothetical protein K0M31_015531 [Melipona bicolor]|uniref:Apolipophorin-III n=1 Tax=Melipona bicolor TaxID=60889 RepID=A0AA40KF49_9HYME|nr:hypothetical protein K0M31_015531 [Melipona bicolor]